MQCLILQCFFNLFLILILCDFTALLSLLLLVLFEIFFALFSLFTLHLIILIELLQAHFQVLCYQSVLRTLILLVLLSLLKQKLPRSLNLLSQVVPAPLLLLVYCDGLVFSPFYLSCSLDLTLISLLSMLKPRLLYLEHLIYAVEPLLVLPLEHPLNELLRLFLLFPLLFSASVLISLTLLTLLVLQFNILIGKTQQHSVFYLLVLTLLFLKPTVFGLILSLLLQKGTF